MKTCNINEIPNLNKEGLFGMVYGLSLAREIAFLVCKDPHDYGEITYEITKSIGRVIENALDKVREGEHEKAEG